MSRSCLALDVGYMLWQRENGPVHVDRGLLWDSSPQSGRDWFISEYRYMRKDTSHATILETVVFLHDASRRLLELASRMGSLEQEHDEDDLGADGAESLREEAARLSQAMNSLVGFHLLPLQVLGQQRSLIDEYLHCLLNVVHHEVNSSSHAFDVLGQLVSITSDWGTEAGLASVPSASVVVPFPHYAEEELELAAGLFSQRCREHFCLSCLRKTMAWLQHHRRRSRQEHTDLALCVYCGPVSCGFQGCSTSAIISAQSFPIISYTTRVGVSRLQL